MSVVRAPRNNPLGFGITQAFTSYIFKDFKTRLFIPNVLTDVIKLSLLSDIQSLMSGEVISAYVNAGFSKADASFIINKIINEVINSPFLILGVTNITAANDHVIPTTKGIGSYGELIHLLGVRNEQISLTFTTDNYPSIFGSFLRKLIKKILSEAYIVYIIDELTGYMPALMRNYKVSKSGKMIGAISGSLNFINLEKKNSSLKSAVTQSLKQLGNSKIGNLSNVKYAFPVSVWLGGVALQFATQAEG